jgi:hypothetical protein
MIGEVSLSDGCYIISILRLTAVLNIAHACSRLVLRNTFYLIGNQQETMERTSELIFTLNISRDVSGDQLTGMYVYSQCAIFSLIPLNVNSWILQRTFFRELANKYTISMTDNPSFLVRTSRHAGSGCTADGLAVAVHRTGHCVHRNSSLYVIIYGVTQNHDI